MRSSHINLVITTWAFVREFLKTNLEIFFQAMLERDGRKNEVINNFALGIQICLGVVNEINLIN